LRTVYCTVVLSICSLAAVGVVVAQPGIAASAPFAIDTIAPGTTFGFPSLNLILHADEPAPFRWSIDPGNDPPADLLGRAVVLAGDSGLDSLLFSGADGPGITWPWLPPEISSGHCRLLVTIRDEYGNVGRDTTAAFSIVPSGTWSPRLPALPLLAAPYPNPFNPGTTIEFTLADRSVVTLGIHDLQGRRLATLVAGELPAGEHRIAWLARDDDGRRLGAGTYLVRLETQGGVRLVRKVVLLP